MMSLGFVDVMCELMMVKRVRESRLTLTDRKKMEPKPDTRAGMRIRLAPSPAWAVQWRQTQAVRARPAVWAGV